MLEKRQIHINLTKDVYVEFKKQCAEYRVTMQETLEYFIIGIADENDEIMEMFKKISKMKKEKKFNRIAKMDQKGIFDLILEED